MDSALFAGGAVDESLILVGHGFEHFEFNNHHQLNDTSAIEKTAIYVVATSPINVDDSSLEVLTLPIKEGNADLTWAPGWNSNHSSTVGELKDLYSSHTALQYAVGRGEAVTPLFAVNGGSAWRAGARHIQDLLTNNFWIQQFPSLVSLYIPRRIYVLEESESKLNLSETRMMWRSQFDISAFFPYWDEIQKIDPATQAAGHCALAWRWLSENVKDAELALFEMEKALILCPTDKKILANWAIVSSFCGKQSSLIETLNMSNNEPEIARLLRKLCNRYTVEPPLTKNDWVSAATISPTFLPNDKQRKDEILYDLTRSTQRRVLINNPWDNPERLQLLIAEYVTTLVLSDDTDLHLVKGTADTQEAVTLVLSCLIAHGDPDSFADITIDETESIELLPLMRYSAGVDLTQDGDVELFRSTLREIFAALRANQ